MSLCLSFLPDTDIIMTLMQYLFVALLFPLSYEEKVWHSIEQRTIDAIHRPLSIYNSKRICAEGGHFKHF